MSTGPPRVYHHQHQTSHTQQQQQQQKHAPRVQKVLLQPIAIIFRYLQDRTPVSIWLHDRNDMRLEGIIVGFDEYMNIVLDSAEKFMSGLARNR